MSVEVVQPIAQIGIGLALQLGARRRYAPARPRPRRSGRWLTASRSRRSQPRSWAIMRKASSTSRMLALAAVVAAVDQVVDRGAHGADRRLRAG